MLVSLISRLIKPFTLCGNRCLQYCVSYASIVLFYYQHTTY
nr:MAG TPA: hypothetical protein [Caudoviricetes sp.]